MKREKWIDILRGIAITAVVVDHFYYLYPQYRNTTVWWHTYFSIPWFIFLSGVTNTLSFDRKNLSSPRSYTIYLLKRFNLLVPYFFASLISYLFLSFGNFNLSDFWHGLLYFSIQPTYYFINLILQLYLIFPFLYQIVKSTAKKWHHYLFLLSVGIIFSIFLMIRQPTWPFSPAGRAFGGVYFTMFLAGIIFARIKLPLNKIVTLSALLVFLGFEIYLFYSRGSFISIVPSYPLLLWSLSLMFLVTKIIFRMGEKNRLFLPLAFLGRYSIWIYLYHYLVLNLLRNI